MRDLDASARFYAAVFGALGIPLGGRGDGYFWYDELFVSTAASKAASGELANEIVALTD